MSNKKQYGILKYDGIECKTDIGLISSNYTSSESTNRATWHFLSLYGSSQQVKALFAITSTWRSIEYVAPDNSVIYLVRSNENLHFKGYNFGYGRQHAFIWSDQFTDNIIFWFNQEEKKQALYNALSKRCIPFTENWLPWLEKLLIDNEILWALKGWGGIEGYMPFFYSDTDNEICDLICKKLKKGEYK